MRALLIAGTTVSVVHLDPTDTLGSMRKHLGCHMVASGGNLSPVTAAWVDDEGRLDRPDCLHQVDWYRDVLAGNILITGLGAGGETLPTNMKIPELKSRIEGTYFVHELVYVDGDKEVVTEAYGRDEQSMRNKIEMGHPDIQVKSIRRINPGE